ncbi:hypothetical protein KBC04_00305 [Candidatus Babeliales bacterium]|nr:hypothetical protein [Candidatus Babeliales bacterium]MBP9843467.1 hypothetical protein [Candidatus Babeliales bacterium]
MKKLMFGVVFISLFFAYLDCSQKRSKKKSAICKPQKTQKYEVFNVMVDSKLDWDKLKRRYPRKYNLKHNMENKAEPDDFGYPYQYHHNKKSCNV